MYYIPKEIYLARLEAMIRDAEDALRFLPEGPAREEMERLLAEMRRIAEQTLRSGE